MTIAKPPIWARAEPIFGVCEALGDDFGVNPHWLRAALIPVLIWQPLWTLGAYALVGLIVLATRLILPDVCETPVLAPASPGTEPANDTAQEQQRRLAA